MLNSNIIQEKSFDIENKFENRLRLFIKTYFKSIKNFCEKTGINYTQMNLYTLGDRKPGFDAFLKIAEQGCNINWLLTGKGKMTIDDSSTDEKLNQILERLNK